MVGRLAAAVVAILVAISTVPATSAAEAATNAEFAHAYTHDGIQGHAALTDNTTERGPPAWVHTYTGSRTHDAVNSGSHGTSARSEAGAPRATTAYHHPAELVQVARSASTTKEWVEVAISGSVIRDRGVAANTASKVGPTTAHGAERIAGAAATRGGVLAEEQILLLRGSGQLLTQAGGASVRVLQNEAGRFDVVVDGSGGLITTFSNLSQKSLERLGTRYGWE